MRRNDGEIWNVRKKFKKDNFFKLINLYLFFFRTSASGETGSPRLFTYHEIWPSAIVNDHTIYCLIKNKKAPQISLRGSLG